MLNKGFSDYIPPKYYMHQLLPNEAVIIITHKIHCKQPGMTKAHTSEVLCHSNTEEGVT